MINNLDPDLKFIFQNLLIFIINQPFIIQLFKFTSYHSPHTKNNISLSLAKRIVSVVTNNRENRLKELKEHLLDRKHPQHFIVYSFTKMFQQKF